MPLKNGKTTASLQTTLVGSVIPPGTIAPFGGGTVPEGWLLCDGTAVSRATYSALFSAVGTVHGQGNGSSTFHLPDYRGRFLRGADNMGTGAAGRDPGDNRTAANTGGNSTGLGSVQSDEFKSHGHTLKRSIFQSSPLSYEHGYDNVHGAMSITDVLNEAGGTETRPQNANVVYIIKV